MPILPHLVIHSIMAETHQGVDEANGAAAVRSKAGGGVDVKGESGHRLGGNITLLSNRVCDSC